MLLFIFKYNFWFLNKFLKLFIYLFLIEVYK